MQVQYFELLDTVYSQIRNARDKIVAKIKFFKQWEHVWQIFGWPRIGPISVTVYEGLVCRRDNWIRWEESLDPVVVHTEIPQATKASKAIDMRQQIVIKVEFFEISELSFGKAVNLLDFAIAHVQFRYVFEGEMSNLFTQ